MIRPLALFRLLARQSLAQLLTYRLTAAFIITFGALFALAEVVSLLVYYRFAGQIAGWDFYSFLALLATYHLIQHLYQLFFILSHESLMEKILAGELDYDLLRPVDSQLWCSLQRLDYPSLINLIIPVALLLYCRSHLPVALTPLRLLAYGVLVLCGVALYYLLSQFFVTSAFWVERPQKLAGFTEYLFEFAARPRSVYPRLMQAVLSLLLPVLTAVQAPVDLLRGELDGASLGAMLLILALLALLVRWQWRVGLRRYASAA